MLVAVKRKETSQNTQKITMKRKSLTYLDKNGNGGNSYNLDNPDLNCLLPNT